MTIKEIAELCDVEYRTVLRWSKECKLDDKLSSSLQNLDNIEESGHGKAADLSMETAAAIIRAGGREALAFLLEENAATKNALAVQSEAMAKFREQLEMLKSLPEQFEKFKGQAVEAYKKLEARVGEYVDGLDNMAAKAKDEVIEYLVSAHKPSAHEAQLAELKRHLSLTIVPTGDKRDKIDLFRLYPGYESAIPNPIPKDAFAAHVTLLYPQVQFKGGVFIGCRFDY